MGRLVRVTLTGPQADAVLSAIAEITAGAGEEWPHPLWKALLNARTKILAAAADA
jgi:hypothetical protein